MPSAAVGGENRLLRRPCAYSPVMSGVCGRHDRAKDVDTSISGVARRNVGGSASATPAVVAVAITTASTATLHAATALAAFLPIASARAASAVSSAVTASAVPTLGAVPTVQDPWACAFGHVGALVTAATTNGRREAVGVATSVPNA